MDCYIELARSSSVSRYFIQHKSLDTACIMRRAVQALYHRRHSARQSSQLPIPRSEEPRRIRCAVRKECAKHDRLVRSSLDPVSNRLAGGARATQKEPQPIPPVAKRTIKPL